MKTIEQLIRKAEDAIDKQNTSAIDECLSEISLAIKSNPSDGSRLGPFIGKLRSSKPSETVTLDWVPVLQGHLAIGHRPKMKTIHSLGNPKASHIVTLLSESEGSTAIGNEVKKAGLVWLWLPMNSAQPPPPEDLPRIKSAFESMHTALEEEARIFIHCSAGIHRTGMITYAFLRYLKFSFDEVNTLLSDLRQTTSDGVGEERKQWGEQFA